MIHPDAEFADLYNSITDQIADLYHSGLVVGHTLTLFLYNMEVWVVHEVLVMGRSMWDNPDRFLFIYPY